MLRFFLWFQICALSFHLLEAKEEILPSKVSLQRLVDGNHRFVNQKAKHPQQTKERIQETAAKQEPFAVVVGCSDSRVSPEIIFDQGIGDIFVVRMAGNIVDPLGLDSVEYAVNQLKAPLVIVLGHKNCGLMNAVLLGKSGENDVENLAAFVQPLVKQAKALPGDPLENLTKLNIDNSVEYLKSAHRLQDAVKENKIMILGAYYDTDTGQVAWLQNDQ